MLAIVHPGRGSGWSLSSGHVGQVLYIAPVVTADSNEGFCTGLSKTHSKHGQLTRTSSRKIAVGPSLRR
eukprot:2933255-Rhodomonas_salina.1